MSFGRVAYRPPSTARWRPGPPAAFMHTLPQKEKGGTGLDRSWSAIGGRVVRLFHPREATTATEPTPCGPGSKGQAGAAGPAGPARKRVSPGAADLRSEADAGITNPSQGCRRNEFRSLFQACGPTEYRRG
jgi:hypothetical protein